MPVRARLWASPTGTKNVVPTVVNMGGGPNMIERSLFASDAPTLAYSQWYTPGAGSPAVSTSDYYFMNGLYRFRPYDLDTMGSEGATVKAREGFRYVWLIWLDHPGNNNYADGSNLYAGYSNDPQVLPSPLTMRMLLPAGTTISVVDQNGFTQSSFNSYHLPFLVYNPDSAGDKFYIYSEGANQAIRQHQLTLITSSDLLSATLVGPTIPTTVGTGWTSFGMPQRLGVNNWVVYSFGKIDGSSGNIQFYKYTSTDGWAWTPDYSTIVAGPGPFLTVGGQDVILASERGSSDYLAYFPVNASKVITGGGTRLSTAFASDLTEAAWQTVLQDVTAYEEDGVASILITRGFPPSDHDRTNVGPYLGNSPNFYNVTCSITSNVMDVTAVPGGVPPLAVGFKLTGLGRNYSIVSLGTGTGGVGTYNITSGVPNQSAGTSMQISTNGGLWHQMVDQYYLITDATAAASAAPLGVKADCTSGVVTISWNNCLPHQNYRVYRGTTSATQSTLVGNVTGLSITDSPTPGAQYWYKVVTMNGTEQKSRVVDVYCSNNSQMVNRHVRRVINDGGDSTKIDMTFLASVDTYLSSNNYYRYLLHWADARFGVKFDGSGFVSKVYCLGTTRLPRGGDYTPTTSNTYPSTSSNTSYSANSFRGTTPSWINNATTARGYFGNGRGNNIQRKNEITVIAAYQRPGTTGFLGMMGYGEGVGFGLYQANGSSGNVTFGFSPDRSTTYTDATVPFASGTAAHVAAGVFDGTNITCYLDGVAGTSVNMSAANNPTMANDTILRGKYLSAAATPVLVSGTSQGRFNGMVSGTITYNMTFSQAQATFACLAVFEKGSAQIVSDITAMYA